MKKKLMTITYTSPRGIETSDIANQVMQKMEDIGLCNITMLSTHTAISPVYEPWTKNDVEFLFEKIAREFPYKDISTGLGRNEKLEESQ